MALELRFGQRARSTKDLDLALQDMGRDGPQVREEFIDALSADPDGDWFDFRVRPAAALDVDEAGRPGWRLPVTGYLAGREFAAVRVDVVARAAELTMTERVLLPGVLAFAGIAAIDVEAVHPAQQFAEKLHALTRTYRGERPSSRVKDLPDLMLLIEDGLMPSRELLTVCGKVFADRGTHALPTELTDPPADWQDTYKRLVDELDVSTRTAGAAINELRAFWVLTLDCENKGG
jgi:hypothetical protein